MSDPQPERLNKKPPRAESWQPDNPTRNSPGQSTESVKDSGLEKQSRKADPARATTSRDDDQHHRSDREQIREAVSPEAEIARDPMTGNKVPSDPDQ